MLFPLKKICQAKGVRRDGTSVIYIQYCFSSTRRTLLATGIDIPLSYWDSKNQKVKDSLPEEYSKAEQHNAALESISSNGMKMDTNHRVHALRKNFKDLYYVYSM